MYQAVENRRNSSDALRLHAGGGTANGLDDFVIARAAAEIAHHPILDIVVAGFGFSSSSALAATTIPGVQMPH